jgi:hypothetical protein
MKNIKIKITKEQSDLFKHTGNIVSLSNGDVYMNIPYWLKETDKENVYEHLTIEQLPDDIKNERMYSEEEVIELLNEREDYLGSNPSIFDYLSNKEWFEQFKKK